MENIILNEEGKELDISLVPNGTDRNEASTRVPVPAEQDKMQTVEKNAPVTTKKRKKQARALVIFSIIFTSLSLPCGMLGLVPFQLIFVLLGLLFYVIDRKKNGKRGISLFGMICTLVTFIMIFVTLIYSILLLGIGIYTKYVNPEPYNFVMGSLKGLGAWFLGIFGINFNF